MSKVIVQKGAGGYGGPLTLAKEGKRDKVLYVTGGVKPDIVDVLCEKLNAEAVDGFKTGVPDEEVICVVINCGGTLRCGVYPQKRVPTINILKTGKSGPLAMFIKEDIYVSAVTVECIKEGE